MAWEDLQQASFRGVAFDCETIADSAVRALAEHTYPYRDGADVEDLGRGPRTMRLRAKFWSNGGDDDYKVRLDAFIVALETAGAAEMVHPVFGSMPRVQVSEFTIDHGAEDVDQAAVSVTFIEVLASVDAFSGATATQDAAAIETAAEEVSELSTEVLVDQVGGITGLGSLRGFGIDGAAEIRFSDIQFQTLTMPAPLDVARIDDLRSVMGGVPSLLGTLPGVPQIPLLNSDSPLNPRSWASDLTASAGALLDTHLNIGSLLPFDLRSISIPGISLPDIGLPRLPSFNLPDDLTGLRSVARQIAGFGASISGIASSAAGARNQITTLGGLPDAAQRVMTGFRNVSAVFSPPVRVNPYASATPSVSSAWPITLTPAARQSPADVQVVAVHAQTEFALSLAVAARRVLEVEAKVPMFTPAELQEVANTARAALDGAVTAWRQRYSESVNRPVIEGLRNTALLVQASAQSLIVRRPPLTTRTLTAPGNTRLLSHLFYGDHRRALELVRLNNYGRHPVLVAGDKVQAYAR